MYIFIACGMAGSGKSELARRLREKFPDVQLFALDDFKVRVAQRLEFDDYIEYTCVRRAAIAEYELAIIRAAKIQKPIYCDYTHTDEFQSFFDYVAETFNYTTVKIDFNHVPFDECWANVLRRDVIGERLLPLLCKSYHNDSRYTLRDISKFEDSTFNYYNSGRYNSLQCHETVRSDEFLSKAREYLCGENNNFLKKILNI